ncbi:MAG: peroxiredoxin family protein [Bacteroidia bacterium]|nr:peroxiredoxin family protein [Bacteroidia bacterium]MDW8347924.1 redoxin domain-containing protein [Bacteroidia bacterium]
MKKLIVIFFLLFNLGIKGFSQESIADLAKSATGLNIGDKAPNFSSVDTEGRPVNMQRLRGKNNVILMFYSGPLYSLEQGAIRNGAVDQIAELVENGLNAIDAKQIEVILVTSDTPNQIKKLKEQFPKSDKFHYINDVGHRIMDMYQASFKIPKNHPDIQELVKQNKIRGNIAEEYYVAPAPMIFLITKDGRIKAKFSQLNIDKMQEAGLARENSVAYSWRYIEAKIQE